MGTIFSSTTVLVLCGLIGSVYNAGAQTYDSQSSAQPNFYITTPQTGELIATGDSTSNQYTSQQDAGRSTVVSANANFYTGSPAAKSSSHAARPATRSQRDQSNAQVVAYNTALKSHNSKTQYAAYQASPETPNYYTQSATGHSQSYQAPPTYQTANSTYVAKASTNKKGFISGLFHRHDSGQQVAQVSNNSYKASKLNGTTMAGTASWYGKDFDGGKTASGERYNMESMTAAHKTLPFGTLVKVRNERNGQECVVRINNRGPFIKGRILDVSKAAARRLDMIGSGVAKVSCQVIGRS